ncbi:actin-depolymerizing factor AdfA [Volvox carteri f. nagariensis]|uniref:Actin-depolymerizing factor AdfA n=1 Tax=Volvox carteri f. nagariensis TaxID=3068 RepID=D8UFN6_VOLCA|nr:actin-depolymerizing factor AdfA [Volvox carteri f. nagariensis]EFJ41491.1 actin-depolymerizing factor AdfA [Volvox carteri f. nagariensis]|eukprot:XP_002957436.1 actin-depolymerizing factor AdfA [Volvox carteri f. nagariensis]
MADLAVLRTAKQALDEGLVNPDDYDFIKKAFLRAQQIKAGLDAGFIKEDDYVQARDSFLHSLDFALVGNPASAGQQSRPGSPKGAQVQAAAQPLPSIVARFPQPSSTLPHKISTPQLRESPTAAQTTGPSAPHPGPPPSGLGSRTNSGQHILGGSGTVPIPTDLPSSRGPRTAAMAPNKTSMSGICVNEQCIAIFNHIKTKSAYKWVTFKVNDAGNEVVVDQLGGADATYEQFVNILPENNCRYAVYDYAYQNADTNQTINKLVFVHWAPDSSTTKHKMMYASTKDFLKSYLDGLGAELQATDTKEAGESEMRERVHQAITRK